MAKVIDLDDLLAYHNELASHIKLLTRDTTYTLGEIVKWDERYFKCTTAGDTDTTRPDFSTTGPYTDGTVEWTEFDPNNQIYEVGKSYKINDLVVYNDKWYKCITAHTATSTFDTTKWTEVGGGGTGIETWTSGTSYNSGDIVLKDNTIYVANTTTSTTWDSTEWDVVNDTTLVGGTYYSQKALTGIVQPYTTTLKVADTNYCKPPVEVMKHYNGTSPTSTNLETYTNSARYSFDDTKIKFSGGSANLINPRYIKTSAPEDINGLNVTTSDLIDFSEYSNEIISVNVDNNTFVAIDFSNSEIVDRCGNTIVDNLSVGLPTFDSDNYVYGNSSAYFDGTQGIFIPYDSKFNFGTGDFTVDFWWKQPTSGNMNTGGQACVFAGQRVYGTMSIRITDSVLYIGSNDVANQTQGSVNSRFTDGEFHHFAIVRASGIVYYFIDGDLRYSGSNATSYSVAGSSYIAIFNQVSSSSINGLIGNINGYRISNMARWTSNFNTDQTFQYTYQVQNITKVSTSSQEYQEVYS